MADDFFRLSQDDQQEALQTGERDSIEAGMRFAIEPMIDAEKPEIKHLLDSCGDYPEIG